MAELPEELTAPEENPAYIRWLLDDLRDEVVVWVGAGLSVPLGYPTWAEFLTKQAGLAGAEEEIGELLSRGEYEDAAEVLLVKRARRAFHDDLERFFDEALISGSEVEGAISYVPRLTRGLIVTTNFDRVLEQVCFEQLQESLDRIMGSDEQMATAAVQSGRRAILKIHGDIKERSHRVLTKNDYERAYGPIDEETGMPGRLVRLLDLIFAKRVLFLGASLQADRTVRALQHVVARNEDLVHYAIVECPDDQEKRRDRAQSLSSLGVRPIWYPEGRHELVETLLAYLVATREDEDASPDGGVALPPPVQDGEEWLHFEQTEDAPREIIEARLAVLGGSLDRPDDPREWPRRLNLDTPVVPPTLWGRLTEEMNTKRDAQSKELCEIAKQLAPAAGADPQWGDLWGKYSKLNSESRRLFRDFLELLGGLAVRGKLGDERLLRIADELIKECAEQDMWAQDSSVAIPAIEEALARTPTGIVRLRFPEWTIWNLALVTHEFGHVVMDRKLRGPLHEATEKRAKGLLRRKETAERDKRRARQQLQVLLADVFAAYVLGPSYGCAAIVLKLDPSADADSDSPADAERAHVILAILKKLEAFERSASYREVVAFLEDRWAQLIERVEPGAALKRADVGALDEFVDKLYDAFGQESKFLRSNAAYPHHVDGKTNWEAVGEGGWLVAERWARGWLAGLGNGRGPAVEIPARSRVRDVLNAAWICRIAEPSKIGDIEQLAEEACLELVPKREGEGTEATATPSQPTPRKVPARL